MGAGGEAGGGGQSHGSAPEGTVRRGGTRAFCRKRGRAGGRHFALLAFAGIRALGSGGLIGGTGHHSIQGRREDGNARERAEHARLAAAEHSGGFFFF